ncbi:MAG TPA: DNA polymerase III subunit delta [Candidatus Dormibacteraeota bacterium]|jgi:DNA polymerase-3 subunit delta|nr:DNA polymerase III subunit delta [Candidatus Dormibacteraeota bacterium]
MTAAPVAPPPLLLIHGEERHLVDAAAADWLDAARAQCSSDLNVEVIDAPAKLDQVRRSLAEIPFLDPVRYLMVRDAPQLSERGRKGADPADLLVTALQEKSPTTSVCLVVHGKVAATNAVLGAIRALDGLIVYHAPVRGRDLRAWLEDRLRGAGLRVPRPAVDQLLAASNGDLGVLENEIAKLRAFAGGRQDLTADEVIRLAGGDEQIEVWSVLDRLLSPAPGRGAAAVDNGLGAGLSSQYLIATLGGQIRDLLVAQDLLRDRRGGPAGLAAAMGIPPWRADRLARQAGAVPGAVLEGWMRSLQRVDADVKGGRIDDASALRSFALRAARDVTSARQARAS